MEHKLNISNNSAIFIVAVLESLLVLMLFLIYGQGRLFYGGNASGIYRYDLFPIDLSNLFANFSLLLSFSNYYAAFYVQVFLSAFVTSVSLMYLLLFILKGYTNRVSVFASSSVTTFLYFFNLTAIGDTFKSYLGNFSILEGGLILFMLTSLKVIGASNKKNHNFPKYLMLNGFLAGIILPTYPNFIRIALVEFTWFICLFLYNIYRNKILFKSWIRDVNVYGMITRIYFFIKYSGLWIIFFIIGSLDTLLPFLSQLKSNITTSIGISSSVSGLGHLPIVNLIRMFGPVNAPYDNSFISGHSIIFYISFIWTIFIIIIPFILVVSRKYRKNGLVLFISIFTFYLIWGAGYFNYLFLEFFPRNVSLLSQIFIYWEPSITIYPILGTILMGFTISYLVNTLLRIRIKPKRPSVQILSIRPVNGTINQFVTIKRLKVVLIVFIIIAPFSLTMLPELSGQTFGQYYNQNIKGYKVPSDYESAYKMISNIDRSNLIVYPEINTFITTSWGFQGPVNFYTEYFYPSNVISIASNNQYGQYLPNQLNYYFNVTSPLIPVYHDPNYIYTQYNESNLLYGAKRVNDSASDFLLNSYNYSSSILIKNFFNHSYNFSNMLYLGINLNSNDIINLTNDIQNGTFSVGIISSNYIFWLNSKYSYVYKSQNNNTTEVIFSILSSGISCKQIFDTIGLAYSSNKYFNNTYLNITGITVYSTGNTSVNNLNHYFTVDNSFRNLENENSYILLDESIEVGMIYPLQFTLNIIRVLILLNLIQNIYNGNDLKIYKIE